MSDIAPINRPHQPTPPSAASSPRAASPAVGGTNRSADQVEFSDAAQFLNKIHQLPDIRQDLVDRVRGEIANGTYETDDKVNQAVDQLTEDLF